MNSTRHAVADSWQSILQQLVGFVPPHLQNETKLHTAMKNGWNLFLTIHDDAVEATANQVDNFFELEAIRYGKAKNLTELMEQVFENYDTTTEYVIRKKKETQEIKNFLKRNDEK